MQENARKVVLVTGAGSGIGTAVTVKLVEQGADVIAVDRSPDGLQRLSSRLPGIDVRECDISQADQVAALFDWVGARGTGLDGLINAAGIVVTARFLDFTVDDWERTLRVNVTGTYLVLKHSAARLRERKGSIVNFSSMAGKIPNQFTAPYAASKAAVISLTRSAAVALAPDVRVNCVCPGIIDTPMWGQLGRELGEIGAPINFESRSQAAPLARAGTADEVAAAALFLLSEDARFITGEDLNVSGGLVMH
jgi:NAD(P)-dependent dehydrogenase (short-subunit alcohol dehydrogenase family)